MLKLDAKADFLAIVWLDERCVMNLFTDGGKLIGKAILIGLIRRKRPNLVVNRAIDDGCMLVGVGAVCAAVLIVFAFNRDALFVTSIPGIVCIGFTALFLIGGLYSVRYGLRLDFLAHEFCRTIDAKHRSHGNQNTKTTNYSRTLEGICPDCKKPSIATYYGLEWCIWPKCNFGSDYQTPAESWKKVYKDTYFRED